MQLHSLRKEVRSRGRSEDKYIDGTYEVSVPCKPDEDEDFTEYQLSMKVTIRNDKIVSITDVSGDGDAANDSYIKKAANGTSSKKVSFPRLLPKECRKKSIRYPEQPVLRMRLLTDAKGTGNGFKTRRDGGAVG